MTRHLTASIEREDNGYVDLTSALPHKLFSLPQVCQSTSSVVTSSIVVSEDRLSKKNIRFLRTDRYTSPEKAIGEKFARRSSSSGS